jgi:hypothetical protein
MPLRRLLVAFSVDLDEVECYHAIHGLPPGGTDSPIYDRAIPRFLELFARESVPATFFAVGRDALRPDRAARLREAVAAGHEPANHSLHHHYDLVRRPPAVIVSEVAGGRAAIRDATGRPAGGFRAPGYTLSQELVEILEDLGVSYDSSVLPSPAYFAARAAAIVWKAAMGHRSRSLLAGLDLALAPRRPYRMRWPPFVRRAAATDASAGVRELPIAVLPWLRVPFIGTSLVLAGPAMAGRMVDRMVGLPLVNLELHGIDLCGPGDPGMAALAGHQPDAAVPLDRKQAVLAEVIRRFRGHGAEFVTLESAADLLFQKPLKG